MSRLDFCQYELVDDCYDWKNDHCDGCNIFKAYCEGERRAKNSIVRCKDCRHRDLFSCPLADNDFQKDEDFCSWGERKEESEDEE